MPNLPITEYKKDTYYDFSKGEISLDWEWVRNPDNNWSFENNCLKITPKLGYMYEIKAKNILLRREQELNYIAETKLTFNAEKLGQQAGITCYYSTVSYIRFGLCNEGLELVINRNRGEERVKVVSEINKGAIYLKVEVNGLNRTFSYSYDGENWMLFDKLTNCIYLCDEGVPDDRKRHTGTLVGIYALGGNNEETMPAYFEYFCYKD